MQNLQENIKALITENPVSKVSTGENIGMRDYLNDAISALKSKDADYYSILFILRKTAEGHESAAICREFSALWDRMEDKYGI